MNDLVKRLRKYANMPYSGPIHDTCGEAADEIERLRAENEEHIAAYQRCFAEREQLQAEIERLREQVRIQDGLISDNADLHDEIERLSASIDADTVYIAEQAMEIERFKKELEQKTPKGLQHD